MRLVNSGLEWLTGGTIDESGEGWTKVTAKLSVNKLAEKQTPPAGNGMLFGVITF